MTDIDTTGADTTNATGAADPQNNAPADPGAPQTGSVFTPPEGPGNLLADAKDPDAPAKPDGTDGKPADQPADQPIEYDLKFPEGMDPKGEIVDRFKTEAAAMKLSQDQAQKLIALSAEAQRSTQEAMYQAWNKVQGEWRDQIKADPEIGGQNLEANLGLASKVIDQLGGEPLRTALNITGAGNNPDVIRAFVKMAGLLTEGTHIAGKPASAARRGLYSDLSP